MAFSVKNASDKSVEALLFYAFELREITCQDYSLVLLLLMVIGKPWYSVVLMNELSKFDIDIIQTYTLHTQTNTLLEPPHGQKVLAGIFCFHA